MTPHARVDNRPIGVFDSGLGGLTVVRALRALLPNESVFYLGDTARVPYGDKSEQMIQQYGCEDARFLIGCGVKMIVVACNTVSAVALDTLRETFPDVPILGVIEAGVDAFMRLNLNAVTVIGTRATFRSDAYRRAIHSRDTRIRVRTLPTPLLAPLVEEGLADTAIAETLLRHYLAPVIAEPDDALLLGCTHYPLLINALQRIFEGRTHLIDSASACAQSVDRFLSEKAIRADAASRGDMRFFVTDQPDEFSTRAEAFLGNHLAFVRRVVLTP